MLFDEAEVMNFYNACLIGGAIGALIMFHFWYICVYANK